MPLAICDCRGALGWRLGRIVGGPGCQAGRWAHAGAEPRNGTFLRHARHAIETGCIDLVLRPNEMAHELVRLGQRLVRAGGIQTAERR